MRRQMMKSISEAIDVRPRHRVRHKWVEQRIRTKKRPKVLEVIGRRTRKYFESSSLVGYRYLVESKRPWIERSIWVILHISTLCMLGILMRNAYVEYQTVQVVTVVDSDNYETSQLEFPGIAICDINRISRKAATKLANEIVGANITDWKFADILDLIKNLGDLYEDTTDPNITASNYLHEILNKYYNDDYDVTTIMRELSPNCKDALSSCYFHGETKNCSEIFEFRKTQYGYCCTFNYIRESDDIPNLADITKEKPRQPYNIRSLGIMNGLSLVMEPFVEDYYYPLFPIIGWKVTIFNPQDFPDTDSGSVSEAFLSPATEAFLDLDVTSIYSTDEIKNIAFEKRKCIFQNELPVLYAGYTYSDCLVDCRAAAIWETCKCRPFYLPRRGNSQYKQKVCSTEHTECLYKYREVYWTVLSDKVMISDEDRLSPYKLSLETSKQCSSCFPACNDTRYYLRKLASARRDRNVDHAEIVDDVQPNNQSILHIYFTKHGSVRLKQETAYYWYELLSNIGGICGVFVGFSCISVVEFFSFVFSTLLECCQGNTRIITRRTLVRAISRKKEERFTQSLYWNEFIPQTNITKRHWPSHVWP